MENKKLTILVIDDDPVNLEILRDYLEDESFNVHAVESAFDGLSYLRANPKQVNLILLDRMMPMMDGVTFVETQSADFAIKHIPVIMVTAAAMSHQIDELRGLPIKDVVTKPFEREKLLESIFSALQS